MNLRFEVINLISDDRSLRIETNNLVFDGQDPLCELHIQVYQEGGAYAYIQVIDIGLDGTLRNPKRYYGRWDWAAVEYSLKEIMMVGGSWAVLPE